MQIDVVLAHNRGAQCLQFLLGGRLVSKNLLAWQQTQEWLLFHLDYSWLPALLLLSVLPLAQPVYGDTQSGAFQVAVGVEPLQKAAPLDAILN